MEWTGLNELREKYLSFFESKGHLRLPSFSLVPQGDKSLLIINAGMAPLKKYFTGELTPPRTRVTTCQKCIRTPDIERVGITARHGTFFEMLGNFSFGDYFKHEATAWAWEFCTKVLEMPADKIYISVYQDDDEAYDIWTKELGVSPDHMVRLGKEDNFWEHGAGPCGPCSELYFDRGIRSDVMQAVSDGDAERLFGMKRAQVPALTVALYRTPGNRFAAMQAFEYADLEYRPLTRLQISPQKEGACEA